ncbi:hypothetical protein [Streptomyces aidingensis]|uniref:Uncharacterized protein n=1 Tax=Streptomyces aidingensis TaxID=910347 RepID=A0A1I1PZV5_9ACTN|nr:hypothetical protein [Streptomyces aidingensis]SFD12523.1 hypothetical protein SAMN05421773_11014 [Streptomyces aidingensis]
MDFTTRAVGLGGVTIGLCILAWTLTAWWMRDKHKPAAIAPYLLSACYGILIVLSTGGLLGAVAGVALWGGNTAGAAALEYGVGGTAPDVTRSSPLTLTPGGHVLVLLATVVLAGIWKFSGKLRGRRVPAGIITGICLGLSGGIAGWAAVVLAPAVNIPGDLIAGLL